MKYTVFNSVSELPPGNCTIVRLSTKGFRKLLVVEKIGERFENIKEISYVDNKDFNVYGFLLPVYVHADAERALKNYLSM